MKKTIIKHVVLLILLSQSFTISAKALNNASNLTDENAIAKLLSENKHFIKSGNLIVKLFTRVLSTNSYPLLSKFVQNTATSDEVDLLLTILDYKSEAELKKELEKNAYDFNQCVNTILNSYKLSESQKKEILKQALSASFSLPPCWFNLIICLALCQGNPNYLNCYTLCATTYLGCAMSEVF
ncbi:MAG TPA: hypothetical protein PKC54_15280 [Ferruginibacter sp.]|nr:hypothetical protein [Ferruginibacter sp.]